MSNTTRYPQCHMRTVLGNCDPIGGFCTSVNESICEALHKVSRPQGEWIKGDYWTNGCGMSETYGYYYSCSLCNEEIIGDYDKCRYNYCPSCGCRMKGEQNERLYI